MFLFLGMFCLYLYSISYASYELMPFQIPWALTRPLKAESRDSITMKSDKSNYIIFPNQNLIYRKIYFMEDLKR